MTPYTTQVGKRRLQEGIRKMEKAMTPAAQVRRSFQLGRPPKPGELPLHRTVVWQRATDALAKLRAEMIGAGLNPEHIDAAIVYVKAEERHKPLVLLLSEGGVSPEEARAEAFEILGRDDVIALGMIFKQFDERAKQEFIFPYRFIGLEKKDEDVLRKAAILQHEATKMRKKDH